MSRESGQTSGLRSDCHEHFDTHGTTVILIKTNELIIVGADSRTSHNRSHRIVDDDAEKVQILESDIYTTFTGSTKASIKLFNAMRVQYNSGAQRTLVGLARYGLDYVRKLNNKSHSQYTVIGVENGKPQAYGFADKEEYKNVRLMKKWFAHGSGAKRAKSLLKNIEGRLDTMSETEAKRAMNSILLATVLDDPSSGGLLRVYIFGSTGLFRHYSIPTLKLYVILYNSITEDEHARTIFMFSRGEIGNDLVTQWFRSGCIIKPVDVLVVHRIGRVDDYGVHRVLLKDTKASIVFDEVRHLCQQFHCCELDVPNSTSRSPCVEVVQFPCLQVVNRKFHFAVLKKK